MSLWFLLTIFSLSAREESWGEGSPSNPKLYKPHIRNDFVKEEWIEYVASHYWTPKYLRKKIVRRLNSGYITKFIWNFFTSINYKYVLISNSIFLLLTKYQIGSLNPLIFIKKDFEIAKDFVENIQSLKNDSLLQSARDSLKQEINEIFQRIPFLKSEDTIKTEESAAKPSFIAFAIRYLVFISGLPYTLHTFYLFFKTIHLSYNITHNKIYNKFYRFERDFALSSPHISSKMQEKILNRLDEITTNKTAEENLVREIRIAKMLARHNAPESYEQNPNSSKIKELRRLLYLYDQEVVDRVITFLYSQVFTVPESRTMRRAAYLYGMPGVGKSYLIQKISEALNIKVAKLSLAGIKPEYLQGDIKNGELGTLISTIIETEGKPLILVIEEGGRMIRSNPALENFWLNFLDTNSIFSDVLGEYISTQNVSIIITDNYEIEEKALNDRMDKIKFPPISKQNKLLMLKQKLPEMLAKYKIGNRKMDVSDLTDSDKTLFTELVKRDKTAGFRAIQLSVESKIAHIHLNKTNANNIKYDDNFYFKIIDDASKEATMIQSDPNKKEYIVINNTKNPAKLAKKKVKKKQAKTKRAIKSAIKSKTSKKKTS